MLHTHHSHHGHPPAHGRRGFRLSARLLIRRNLFTFSLLASALVMYGGTRYLRHVLDSEAYQDADVMRLSSCTARLSHLGVLPEDTGLERAHVSQYITARHRVYDNMAADVGKKGLKLGGVITQGLTQDDLFRMTVTHPDATHVTQPRALKHNGITTQVHIQPVLKSLDIPVRAMIMPLLDTIAAQAISQAVHKLIVPIVPPGGIWVQDSNLFHATIFHASSHVKPIRATPEVITDEHQRIQKVTGSTCPVHAVLERVLITSSGVIVACWQATEQGGEPALLRQDLAVALPNAPPKEAQMVKEPSMLHTTLARLLQPPTITMPDGTTHIDEVDAQHVIEAVRHLSDTLCGTQAVFDEIWFVEEQDLLALALQGRYIKHPARLTCPGTEQLTQDTSSSQ